MPAIETPLPFAAFPDFIRPIDLKLVASLHDHARPLHEILRTVSLPEQLPPSAAWLIGPEGDFTSEEMHAITSAGALPVSLGSLVLRCDTAAAYALSVLSAIVNP